MKQRLYKGISYLLIICVILSTFPYTTHAWDVLPGEIDKIKQLRNSEGFNKDSMVVTDDEAADMAYIVRNNNGGTLLYNQNNQWLNVGVYKYYNIIAYGKRHNKAGESCDVNGEYRYLGYDIKGKDITNDRFQNDFPTDTTKLEEMRWKTVNGAPESWVSKVKDLKIQDRIMRYTPIIDDGKSISYSLSSILRNYLTEGSSNDDARKSYIYVNGIPTLASHGSVKLERWVNGSIRYNTFTIPKFPFDPTITVTTDKTSYTMGAAATSVTAKVTVTANLEIDTELGRTPAEALKNIYLSFEGQNKLASIVDNKATATFDKVFKRGESGLFESDTQGNTVTLVGSIYSMDSIYGDHWGIKHGKPITGQTSTVVYVKPGADPFVDITATPVPDSVSFTGGDVPVKVNVNASLVGYTDLTNIEKVTLYAKFSDDPSEIFQQKSMAISTTANTSFDFKIPKEKVVDGYLDQEFTATAIFKYKTAVNGNPSAKNSASCITNIFTEPPSVGNPPVAKIIAPSQVKAGDEFEIDGTQSYDEDGFIIEYLWSLPGTEIGESAYETDTIWYPEAGNYTIKLKVTDDGYKSDTATKSIVVKPAIPEAKIRFLGTLKENRKVIIDASTSNSPMHYPIVWPSTTIGLVAVSGNSSSDIKYSGVLNGNKAKDILVKKSGTDRVTLSVTNTKGLSNTVSSNMVIAPDLPPIADFSTTTTVMRDPEDINYSKITINDTSYSMDNDYIQNVILTFSYDSDNNRSFNNGSITIDAADYLDGEMKVITTPWGFDVPVIVSKPEGKPVQFDIRTKHVGKYFAELTAIEGFGQETILEFISEADYRFDDTADKPNIEKTIEVINLAPTAGFNMTNKRKADIVIALPHNYTQADVDSQLNSKVIPGLVSNNMDYNIRYVNYEAYKPQPVDNYYYWLSVDRQSGHRNTTLWSYNYTTDTATSKRLSYLALTSDIFITDSNYVYYLEQGSFYVGDGKSQGYYSLERLNGNTGTHNVIFSTYADAEAGKGGSITSLRVNEEGTIFYDYKGVTYGCKIDSATEYKVTSATELNGALYYSQYSTRAPIGYTYSWGTNTYVPPGEVRERDFWEIYSTKDGVKTTIATDRRSWDKEHEEFDEDIILGKFYPTPVLNNTIDKIFKNVAWTEGYEKYFVVLSSEVNTELQGNTAINNIVLKSAPEDISLVMLGNSKNKTEFENLISRNDGDGIFYDITNLDDAIGKFGNYILNRINVDLVINYKQSVYPLTTIQTKVNALLKPKLAANNISSKIMYVSAAADMNSALNSAVWNPLNDHMFIHIQETTVPELNDSTKRADILDSLKGAEADIIGLGKSASASQFNSLISEYNNEGAFFDITTIDTAIINLGSYIVDNARRKSTSIYKYVILDNEVDYNTTYMDTENDPLYAERWKYIHNETYYENNLGKITDSGQYRATPYTVFNKTGKYELTYAVRDNPKDDNLFDNYRLWSNEELSRATIYVHRRPIASYIWSVTYNSSTRKYGLVTTDTSEDLDHTSRADKGMVQWQWKWKLLHEADWQPGLPPEIVKGSTYLVELMVQDMEGAWSEPFVQQITVPNLIVDAIPPFRDWGNTDVTVNVKTTSSGANLKQVNYQWTHDKVKPTTGWLSNTSTNFNIMQSSNGEWYLHLEAVSTYTGYAPIYTVKGPYRIDKIPPVITADKTSVAESSEPVTVNVDVTDEGGSGLKSARYAWSKSTTKPTAGWTTSGGSFSTTQDQEGLWYLHVEAADHAGNVTYGYFGSYEVNTYKLENFRVVKVRDLHLESYYYNSSTGKYNDKPMDVNQMAIDATNFAGLIDGLTKGYLFEFEIDSTNFNEAADTIVITPRFYTTDAFTRDDDERDLYWEDSKHNIYKAGEGGHAAWKNIILTDADRTIENTYEAVWRGAYLIPATSWAVPQETTKIQAKNKDLKRDIIVSFSIKGYKNGELKFDYNSEQWPEERTNEKYPYEIGDVIRYDWGKSSLDDIKSKDNR